jgi:GR25 family glycosyltransferase involved in LPS biosynthesis
MSNIKCYCLTIKGSEREKAMIKHLSSIYGLKYEIIYGKKYTEDMIDYVPIRKNQKYWNLSEFSKHENYYRNACSCANGHKDMMKKFLNDDVEWGLICEDDIRLYPTIMNDLEMIVNKYNGGSIYHLSTESYLLYSHQIDKISNEIKLKIGKIGNSAACYLVNKNFAKEYIKTNTPIKFPADIAIWKILNYNIPVIYGLPITFSDFQKKSIIGDKTL